MKKPKDGFCDETKVASKEKIVEVIICSGECLKTDEMKALKHWKINGHHQFDTDIVQVKRTGKKPEDSSLTIYDSEIVECWRDGQLALTYEERGSVVEEHRDILSWSAQDI